MTVYTFRQNMNPVEVRGMELRLMENVGLVLSYPNVGIVHRG